MKRNIEALDSYKHQQYDKLFRQNMQHIMPVIMEKVLKLDIVTFEDLKDKIQTTQQLEVDTLRKVTDRNGKTYIVHIEIQKDDDSKIGYRLIQYRGMLYLKYGLPVKQYVLYLGTGASAMPDRIDDDGFSFSYPLICFSQLSWRLFINARQPEVQMLAILGNPETESPLKIMKRVVAGIEGSSVSNADKLKYIAQLRVLSQLRNFTEELKHIMLKASSFFKKENDPFYQEGIIEGRAEGKDETNYIVVSNLIAESSFDDEKIAQLVNVPHSFVKQLRAELKKK